MCGTVLTEKASWVDRTSIIPLSVEDENSLPVKKMQMIFEEVLKEKLKDRILGLKAGKDAVKMSQEEMKQTTAEQAANDLLEQTPTKVDYEPWSMEELGYRPGLESIAENEAPPELADADDFDFNSYISAKVKLPVGGHTFAMPR